MDPRIRNAITAAIVAAICAYYLWIMVPCRSMPADNYYNWLSDGFQSGSLSLPVKPPKELLALSDPYDPAQNGRYRLHDATLYNGKYYLYFGPIPALVFFIPADALFSIRLHQDTAVVLFLCGGLMSSVVLLRFLLDKISPRVPFWMLILGVLTLGLCNASPILLLRPCVYEVAIACGYFFAMTGLFFIVSGIYAPKVNWMRLAAGSLCAGLAVAARPSYVIFGLALPIALIGLVKLGSFKWRTRGFVSSALSLLVPFGICVLGILAYNYARFGNPLEFGSHYQLQGMHPKNYPIFRADLLVSRLGRYLCSPYVVDAQFPFVHLPGGTIISEPEVGSLPMNPFLLVILPWLFFAVPRNRGSIEKHFLSTLVFLFSFGLLLVLLLSVIANSLVRYHVDYEGVLLLVALVAWCDLAQKFVSQPRMRSLIMLSGAGLIGFGCWVGWGLGRNEISPRAFHRFYDGNALAEQGRLDQAVIAYREAISIAPDFAFAEVRLALMLAAQGRGGEAARCFVDAMQKHLATTAAHRGRGYMPRFQGVSIDQPFVDYCNLANQLLRHQQTDEALLALDGLAQALRDAGQPNEALDGMEAVMKMAAASKLDAFAAKIEQKLPQYRLVPLPSK